MNGHTYKFLKSIFNDVNTDGKREINCDLTNLL